MRVDDAPIALVQRRSRAGGETPLQEPLDDLGLVLSAPCDGVVGGNDIPVEGDKGLGLHGTIVPHALVRASGDGKARVRMVQTTGGPLRADFQNAVTQAIVEND